MHEFIFLKTNCASIELIILLEWFDWKRKYKGEKRNLIEIDGKIYIVNGCLTIDQETEFAEPIFRENFPKFDFQENSGNQGNNFPKIGRDNLIT